MRKEKPILFSTPMVQAIIDGRKSQTRRIIKQAIGWDKEFSVVPIKEEHIDGVQRYEMRSGTKYGLPYWKSKYQHGDIIWVRESWWKRPELSRRDLIEGADTWPKYEYQAGRLMAWDDDELKEFGWKRKPSIHMPKESARIWLECTGVRVERVQDISEEDAIAEGLEIVKGAKFYQKNKYKDYSDLPFESSLSPKQSFKTLWISINGQESWDSNPWVFVYDFKVLSTTGKPTSL